MSTDARSVTVQILGHDYRIRSTEDSDFVRQVARHVDELMRRISENMTSGSKTSVAVLAALNIAEELFRERQNGSGTDAEELGARMEALLGRLDEIVESEPKKPARTSGRRAAVR